MTDTDSAASTRLVAGAELPAPGRWQIDPGHTEAAFIGRHFMLTKVRGRFTGVTGTITVAEVPQQPPRDAEHPRWVLRIDPANRSAPLSCTSPDGGSPCITG
jgi:hypothetical protein